MLASDPEGRTALQTEALKSSKGVCLLFLLMADKERYRAAKVTLVTTIR